MFEHILISVVVVLALSISCITDIRQRRIPNWITFPFVLISVIYAARNYSGREIIICAIVSIAIIIIGLLDGMGAGDTKLLIALTFACGWKTSVLGAYIALCAFVFAEFIKNPKQVKSKIKNAMTGKFRCEESYEKRAFAPYISFGIGIVYLASALARIL